MTDSRLPRKPMNQTPALIVFTDLDGTLLDHDSYSHGPAEPALDRLRAAQIPVILASSKTAAEIAPLRATLGFSDCPAIVENGAGLLPAGADDIEGDDYVRLRAALEEIPNTLRTLFTGFGDMTADQIAQDTSLPLRDAANAGKRKFSEPGRWHGTDDQIAAFLDHLSTHSITARQGGRYLTLSFGQTKADQMQTILARYNSPKSIALGDAPNDIEMLETADHGVIIHNPHRAPLPPLAGEDKGRIQRTKLSGPAGWNAAMQQLLSDHGID
ncbi:HAD-IIB family hydrolase [Pseudaestuariivita rosea]|uniref:HAD-IIB family hydrolase n=1 Tax=Pseudaestuariivita rosea TaxID=2763263 RepID=UPI001F20AE56|nr:HAD-IIB family hydrolase [Pseudaestuariivita rosea]